SEYWKAIYSETFKLDNTTGSLYLLKNLDYENNSFYQFTLHAKDTCNLTAKPANLTIRVKDVQDKPPFFIGLPYMRIIPEGNHTNLPLLRVEAFDGDLGIPNAVNYSLNNSTNCSEEDKGCDLCKRLFTINPSTGDITVTGNLDWEMQDVLDIYGTCNIEVEAKEIVESNVNNSGDTTSKTNITVTIQDGNNHAPKFAKKSYNASIQEKANSNTPIILDGDATGIEVSDTDQGLNSRFDVTLQCENATDCETFAVVPSLHILGKGTLTIRVNNSSLLDYEERQNITITVIATEENNSSHTDTATVIILIENVNEYPPEFKNDTYEANIREGAANWTTVINITATDNDTGTFGEVSYSLSGGSNLFSVNNETGQVFTNCQPGQLDREKMANIYLTIIAKDGGGKMNQAQIVVHLDDVNDNLPIFQQDIYIAYLDENSKKYKDTTLLTVKATDADQNGTENSEVVYTIENTTWDSNFTINNISGEIRLESEIDYEALDDSFEGVINLTIVAFNKGSPAKSSSVIVSIHVQDMNDNKPLFNRTIYIESIKENAVSGTFVGMVSATDADKTERNKKMSYAIEAGGFDNFRVNSTTGNVTVQVGARFDRDNINLYNLTIIAIDQGSNSFTATTTMSVTITDVNNKPPQFNQSSYSVSKPENMTVGLSLHSCIATDPDKNHSLNYSINNTKGWDENERDVNQSDTKFYVRIDENNGTLYVNSKLDRETVAKLQMTIFVTDVAAEENAPQIATATVTFTVLDSDDSPPQFTLKRDFRVGMKRNMEPDKEIFELKSYVTDNDTAENGIEKWIFQNVSFDIKTSELKNKLNGLTKFPRCTDPICVTRNGTIVNNMYYTQDMSGFFNVTVLVRDDAGNDTAYILIFLIADSQVLKMTIYGIRTNIALIKDDILSDCSNVTGLLFVYDSIADHKNDDGTVDTLKTDLFFHIQDHKNNKVLSAEDAKRLLDEYADKLYYARMRYNIVSIESSLKSGNAEDPSSKTIYVLAAVIGLLALVVLIVGYMFFSSSNRYKRKLRAAMPPEKEIIVKKKDEFITPGSNLYAYKENPLLNTDYAPPVYQEIDATSHNSLDTNDVDDAKISPRYEVEEREVTLDMYGDDTYVSKSAEDALEAALREHDNQKQAAFQKLERSRAGHSENEDGKEQMVTGFVNNAYHHDLDLETSDI
ncbi:hypothetical protein ACJMK2_035253, partial [Sinanodonta woodiana]